MAIAIERFGSSPMIKIYTVDVLESLKSQQVSEDYTVHKVTRMSTCVGDRLNKLDKYGFSD